jgi:hypothetical protein
MVHYVRLEYVSLQIESLLGRVLILQRTRKACTAAAAQEQNTTSTVANVPTAGVPPKVC